MLLSSAVSFLTLAALASSSQIPQDESRCTWELVAQPQIIVPGKESVVFVAPKGCNFTQSSSGGEDLMATLSIWDTTHHKVIHGMVWQVQPDVFRIAQQQQLINETFEDGIVMVPFRVPSSLPPSRGLLRLHSQKACHPFVEKQIEDEKCPENCTTKCIEIPFQLASSIRQILLITDQASYTRGDTVRIRYQVLDESTMPRHPAELTIYISDASGTQLHAWNLGYLQRPKQDLALFEEITFPLGPHSLQGKWIICAQDWPYSIIDGDKTHKYCINFHVKDEEELKQEDESQAKILDILQEPGKEHYFVNLTFEAPNEFRSGVPFSGKVLMYSSSEDEVEVLVKLLEQDTQKLLDQQTLLVSKDDQEAVFTFVPIASSAAKLTIEAHLICGSPEKADDIDELEIDEVTAAASDGLHQPGIENRKLLRLASKEIQREKEIPQRNACPIWTQGLERTFKTGDFAAVTVKVSPSCSGGCQPNSGLSWLVGRDNDQVVAWGQQFPSTSEQHECVYRFGLEITSRMAPKAVFKAFRMIRNNGSEIVTYDQQELGVDLEDRTLVILELNTTEVSHSTSMVGMEVFAEPESTICLRGHRIVSDTFDAVLSSSYMRPRQIIRAFEPVSQTWFFQCGTASEDGFYATWIKAPLQGGQWSVEAVSLSPFHGLRMAQPQPLLRTKPIHVSIDGIPRNIRRGEILENLTISARNNMPISLQLTVIVSGSQGILFESSSHFATYQQNVTAYDSIVRQIPMQIKSSLDLGKKNVSVLVTAVAFVEERFVEVDAVHINKELVVHPRGNQVVLSQLDYFCSSTTAGHADDDTTSMIDHTSYELSAEQTSVNFSIKGQNEVVLFIQDEANNELKYKLGIGASSDESVTWLSQVTRLGGEIRLESQNTAGILSENDERHFWLNWKLDKAHVAQLQLGRPTDARNKREQEEVIIKWPIPVTFTPSKITARSMMPEPHVQIRFWQDGQEPSHPVNKGKGAGGGHNRIFHTMKENDHVRLDGTTRSQIILSDGFNLPVVKDDGGDFAATLQGLMEVLRDAATLSILERLQNIPKGSFTSSSLADKMHLVAQDLMYFRNVDGSFGEAMTQQSFRQGMELLFVMSEVVNFYPLPNFLIDGLENWLLKHPKVNYKDVLEWAPRDSKVYQTFASKAQKEVTSELLNLHNEIGPMGVLRNVSLLRSLALMSLSTNETKLVSDWLQFYLNSTNCKCERSHHSELVYVLWTMANSKDNGQQFRQDIFECVHTHSREILSSNEVGYAVIRALVSAYQMSKKLSKTGTAHNDLKISFATSQDLGHSKTWRMKNSKEEVEEAFEEQAYENEPIVSHSIQRVWLEHPIPDKLFFLATGVGCGTVEVQTVYESYHVENADSIYKVSLEASSQEGDGGDYDGVSNNLFITLCIQMKNGSSSVTTSILLDFFTGYEFISLSAISNGDLWFHSQMTETTLVLQVKKVSETCATCATLKFQRWALLKNLAPAKLIVYPSMATSPGASPKAYKQFFHVKSLNFSMEEDTHWKTAAATKDIVSWEPMAEICPCSFKCDEEPLEEQEASTQTLSSLSTATKSEEDTVSISTTSTIGEETEANSISSTDGVTESTFQNQSTTFANSQSSKQEVEVVPFNADSSKSTTTSSAEMASYESSGNEAGSLVSSGEDIKLAKTISPAAPEGTSTEAAAAAETIITSKNTPSTIKASKEPPKVSVELITDEHQDVV